MLKEERQRRIRNLISTEGQATVSELAQKFDVAEMTIRRDLNSLAQEGAIERIHGGAIAPQRSPTLVEPPLSERMDEFPEEKERIAEAVVQMFRPGEKVFLGSGTTTYFVARKLSEWEDLTVVTNALTVVSELARNSQVTVIVVGGFLRRSEFSFIGHIAENALQDLRVEKVVIGMRGIDPEYGLTSDHPQELMTDRKILTLGAEVIIVADHTKFGHVASSRTAPVSAADTIVTTKLAPAEIVDALIAQGVKVVQR